MKDALWLSMALVILFGNGIGALAWFEAHPESGPGLFHALIAGYFLAWIANRRNSDSKDTP